MVLVSFTTAIYYNMIVAWTIFYFGLSFQLPLPWDTCRGWWNTERRACLLCGVSCRLTGCQSSREIERCAEDNGPSDTYVFFNGSCYWGTNLTIGQSLMENTFVGNYTPRLPSEEFFKYAI
jgi:hypothetical protein